MTVRIRWAATLVLAGALVACTDPQIEPPAQPTTGATVGPGAEQPDPRRDQLVAEVTRLEATLASAHGALDRARQADDVAAARAAAEDAVHALSLHPDWTDDLDGDGDVRPPDVTPLLPGPPDAIPEDTFYGDQAAATLTAARAAGAAGREVVDVLRDPLLGDLGLWQGDAAGVLALIDEAADPTDLDAVEAASQELPGSAARALAYALSAVRSRDLPTIQAAAERAQAHLELSRGAIAGLGLATANPPA